MPLPDPGLLVWSLPLLYVLAAVPALAGAGAQRAWPLAAGASVLAVVVALGGAALALAAPGASDPLGHLMVLLVATLGWVIVRYSRQYLAGEPRQPGYVAALLLTLAAVCVVVLADHLGVLVCAWIASSLALHQLLVFYPERIAARTAAHKKFLSNRLSELCMLAALYLVWADAGTLSISALAAQVAEAGHAGPMLQGAAALLALAAILRCALLPVHGWLIQVMEAPTPVSALLHAGVVNLGGFVMIRLAALISEAPFAQTLLVVLGAATAVLAGLVMMTRISIKVRLAWSTCAQMGFMLMQCGLGLYELAMLHLVAHSLYKAHAFLRAGETVADARRHALAPAPAPIAAGTRALLRLSAAPLAIALVAGSALAWHALLPGASTPWIVLLIAGLGLAPLLWQAEQRGLAGFVHGGFGALLLAQVYLGWHHLFHHLVPTPDAAGAPALALFAGATFAALYVLQAWLLAFPGGALSRRLHPAAYAGFWLDEGFTRLAFRVWPARLPQATLPAPLNPPSGERA
jgi:NAD(P)H-quinone oxidoreductase subunit 5